MIPKMDIALNDFSGGEFDADAKRMNGPVALTGGRTAANWRIMNSKKLKNRPGRRVLFLESGRVDKVLMSPGKKFKLVFGVDSAIGALKVYDSTNALVFQWGGLNWSLATVKDIVWCQLGLSIYIFFTGQPPLVLLWDGVATWTLTGYAEQVTSGSQKRTFFYRISPKGITLLPSGLTGAITLVASAPVFTAGWVGTRIRWANRQILITGFTDSTHVNATVLENLPGTQNVHFATATTPTTFNVGDPVRGSNSGSYGIVVNIPNANEIDIQLLSINTSTVGSQLPLSGALGSYGPAITTVAFSVGDTIAGPGGSLTVDNVGGIRPPSAIQVWDEEVMNSFRGWPGSGFVHQNRLGMCNFPSVPAAIGWSAIGQPNDLYVDGTTAAAIFEVVPNNGRVLYVQGGAEGSEFVFCDNRIYYIPISVGNPLRPGSVAFNQIAGDGCYPVQPRLAGTALLFIAAGGRRVSAIVAVGATNRPYDIADLTELHSHMIAAPVAIAVPSADNLFTERYAYVLNGNGLVAVGKYTLDEQQQIKGAVGWIPWTGPNNQVKWIAALEDDVLFTTIYNPGISVVEQLDDALYLDGAMFANAPPTALAPPLGKGPFWWRPGTSIDLMDQSWRSMGTYQIDANGFIVPQNVGGEDLTVASLIGGDAWTAVYEPFIPHAPAGQDSQQRMRKRKVVRASASVQQSSGFILGNRRFPAYNIDDDATKPPPLREGVFPTRPRGRDHDPRLQLVKDSPGPLIITELGIEATV